MLFNSYIFLLVFFPLCIGGYFGLNHCRKYTLAQAFLLVMSLWFYGYFNPSYLLIILLSIAVNFLFTRFMARTESQTLRKAAMILAVLLNFGVLFFFKYYDFFLSNVNALFHTDLPLLRVVLPLGISFFTFQQVSYVIDAYRGEVDQYPFVQYASFVVYFPQLIAGPIVTHDELIPQFLDPRKKQFNWDNFAQGLYMFTLGMAKKVLIADTFGIAANWGFANIPVLDSTNAILASLAYTIQIYFDFSGYCDMAIGIGKMMNIDLPVNFDSPYKAKTIVEFWQRWHKTLTRFFTRYVYIPLGGNRQGALRTYRNIMIVFFASGLWHGANWTFLLWGALHGAFNVITRRFKGFFQTMPAALSWLLTFVFLNLTWILFRADRISDAFQFISRITALDFGPMDASLTNAFLLPEIEFVLSLTPLYYYWELYPWTLPVLCCCAAMGLILFARNAHQRMEAFRPNGVNFCCIFVLLVWCIVSLSGVSTFLYFNF